MKNIPKWAIGPVLFLALMLAVRFLDTSANAQAINGGAVGPTGATGAAGATGTAAVVGTNASITAASLASQAVCALHTDSGCFNSATDATTANCPAGTLTAACTFPTSITIPANVLGSSASALDFLVGSLATATIPNATVEIYLDSTRIYSGTASAGNAGSRTFRYGCLLTAPSSSSTAPLAIGCSGAGSIPNAGNAFSANALNTNTTPAIAIDTTVSHVLSVSVAFSANTTGNMAWLYGMKFSRDGVGLQGSTGSTGPTGATGPSANPATSSNCASNASPAVCAAAAAGSIAFPTGVTSVALTVNTTAVTANSQIFIFSDDTLGARLGVTCNSTLATLVGGSAITARTAGTSFQVTYNGTIATNPLCASYLIVN